MLRAGFTTEDETDSFEDIIALLEKKKHDDEHFIVISQEGELRRL